MAMSRKKFNKLMRAHFTKNMRKTFGADELYLDNNDHKIDPYLMCAKTRVHVIGPSYEWAWDIAQEFYNIS